MQKANLIELNQSKVNKGRLVACENRKKERLYRVELYKAIGINKVGKLSERELFLVVAALYWAEGGKNQRKVTFINSDPKMIVLWIKWVINSLETTKERIICRVEINQIHAKRLIKIEKYWSGLTGIPLSQFRKASLKHSKVKKIFNNNESYFGSLQLTIKKATNLNYEILGYIEGLATV